MANLRSSKKDIRRIAKKRARNQEVRTSLKTYVKKVRVASEEGDKEKIAEALRLATKNLDKAVQRGIIHKNQASRRKSRIAKVASQAMSGK